MAPILIAAGIIVIIVIIVVGGVSVLTRRDTNVVTPREDVCECSDLFQMANRLGQAKAAMTSIDGLIASQSAADSSAGQAAMYTEALYNQGKAVNQAAVDAASKGGWTGKAETPSRNCSPDLSDVPTECLKAALRAHENVHQRECLKNPSAVDYKEAKTMVDYWKEDREGYKAEADYLDRHMKRLMNDPRCKPVAIETYPGAESKEAQQERLARSRRRVESYVRTIG